MVSKPQNGSPPKESMNTETCPDAVDPGLVGTYSIPANAGGGYVWDDVLEYRVWCHPGRGASDFKDGSDYYYAFVTYAEALAFFPKHLRRRRTTRAHSPA
jgi:hypothetical protein